MLSVSQLSSIATRSVRRLPATPINHIRGKYSGPNDKTATPSGTQTSVGAKKSCGASCPFCQNIVNLLDVMGLEKKASAHTTKELALRPNSQLATTRAFKLFYHPNETNPRPTHTQTELHTLNLAEQRSNANTIPARDLFADLTNMVTYFEEKAPVEKPSTPDSPEKK